MSLIRQPRAEKLRLDEAIQRFQATLEPPYVTKFQALQSGPAPKPSDVFRLTEEVNRDEHKVHRTWRQYGSRLQKAMDQIVVFTRVGDVLVGGSQNMIACGVWAAVRLSIQIATGYLGFFDKVSSLWMRIGRSCEVQEELVQLFPQSNELQILMSEYLVVTVNFCQRIVSFAKRPLVTQFTSTFSITFDKEFKEFESQLGHLAKLMNQRVKVLTAQITLESSKTLTTTSKLLALRSLSARKRDYERRRAKLLKRLCPLQDGFDRRQRHERKRGPVHWIFAEKAYQDWVDDAKYRPCVLSGKIGDGKTVTVANIISTLQAYKDPNSTSVAAFFCRGNDLKTQEADTIMGSIAYQLVRSLGSTAERAVNRYTPEKTTLSEVIYTTLKSLPKDRQYFVVIDALDECNMETVEEVIQYFAPRKLNFRCLYSCKVNSPLIAVLKKHLPAPSISGTTNDPFMSISMNSPRRHEEIEAYITSEIEARRHIRNLSPELEAAIRAALIAGAQGMYLWVALQLETIFPRHPTHRTLTDSDLTQLLERLPKDLEAAYDKALEHIPDEQRAKKVFQLVAGSERPLKVDELAVATNVEPGDIHWNSLTFPVDSSALVWKCGGGLLEIMEEDDSVHYIHHSALRHLLLDKTAVVILDSLRYRERFLDYKFRFEEASAVMAAICVTYLSYSMHESRLTKRPKVADDRNIISTVISSINDSHQSQMATDILTNRLISRVIDRRKSPTAIPESATTSTTNIFNLVTSLTLQQHENEDSIIQTRFLEYASSFWLDHTRNFIPPSDISDAENPTLNAIISSAVPENTYTLFSSLVHSARAHIRRPWAEDTDLARVRWALESGHIAVYRIVMRIGFGHGPHYTLAAARPQKQEEDIVVEIVRSIQYFRERVRISGPKLGPILSLFLYIQYGPRVHDELARVPGIQSRLDSARSIQAEYGGDDDGYNDLRALVAKSLVATKSLLEFGVDPNTPIQAHDGSLWSPLCLLLWLLKEKHNGLHQMINEDQGETCIQDLLNMGADVIGFRGDTLGGPRPIFMAIELGLWKLVRVMMDKLQKRDLDFEDEAGRTLLGLLIAHPHSDTLRTSSPYSLARDFLQAGASPNKATSDLHIPKDAYVWDRRLNAAEGLYGIFQGHTSSNIGAGATQLETMPLQKGEKVPPLVLAARNKSRLIFEGLLKHHPYIHQTFNGESVYRVIDRILVEGSQCAHEDELIFTSMLETWNVWMSRRRSQRK